MTARDGIRGLDRSRDPVLAPDSPVRGGKSGARRGRLRSAGVALYRSAAGEQAIRAWCRERLDRWARPHERREQATALGSTHLLTSGSGEPTVLLVPGTNLNAATSLDLVAALAEQRRVMTLDLPGQPGLSAADLPGKDRIPAYGRWLDEVLEPARRRPVRPGRPLAGGRGRPGGHTVGPGRRHRARRPRRPGEGHADSRGSSPPARPGSCGPPMPAAPASSSACRPRATRLHPSSPSGSPSWVATPAPTAPPAPSAMTSSPVGGTPGERW